MSMEQTLVVAQPCPLSAHALKDTMACSCQPPPKGFLWSQGHVLHVCQPQVPRSQYPLTRGRTRAHRPSFLPPCGRPVPSQTEGSHLPTGNLLISAAGGFLPCLTSASPTPAPWGHLPTKLCPGISVPGSAAGNPSPKECVKCVMEGRHLLSVRQRARWTGRSTRTGNTRWDTPSPGGPGRAPNTVVPNESIWRAPFCHPVLLGPPVPDPAFLAPHPLLPFWKPPFPLLPSFPLSQRKEVFSPKCPSNVPESLKSEPACGIVTSLCTGQWLPSWAGSLAFWGHCSSFMGRSEASCRPLTLTAAAEHGAPLIPLST